MASRADTRLSQHVPRVLGGNVQEVFCSGGDGKGSVGGRADALGTRTDSPKGGQGSSEGASNGEEEGEEGERRGREKGEDDKGEGSSRDYGNRCCCHP